MGEYKIHNRFSQEFAEEESISDYLYWPRNKYLVTFSGNKKEYNFEYAMAIEIVGSITRKQSNSKASCSHDGVKYISNKTGVSAREVKSLKSTYERIQCLAGNKSKVKCVYRISYNAAAIINCIIDVFENNRENKLVKKFLNRNKKFNYYRTMLVGKEYMVITDTYKRLNKYEREKEKRLVDLYLQLSNVK